MSPSDPVAHSRLTDAPWRGDERLRNVMRVIAGSDEEVRIVGGAVRDALLQRPVTDIDLATTATPDRVSKRAAAAGFRAVPTGIAHGTVTIVAAGKPFEVTTLREDIATNGRHATVTFGRDWAKDAGRRDFTINALYADFDGLITDYVGGIADCLARRIRFIGTPEARIREDYLRILRFFRFNAVIASGPLDAEALDAAIALRDGLKALSGERIGQEMLKLLPADHAPDVVQVMQDAGILALVLDGAGLDLSRFNRLHKILRDLLVRDEPRLKKDTALLLLASLATEGGRQCEAFAKRLRLSNATRDRMMAAWGWVWTLNPGMTDAEACRLIYRTKGTNAFQDALLLSAASPIEAHAAAWTLPKIIHLLQLGRTFVPPDFPVSGRDLLDLGVPAGRSLGNALEHLKDHWLASDFALTKQQLLDVLQASPGFFAPHQSSRRSDD